MDMELFLYEMYIYDTLTIMLIVFVLAQNSWKGNK